jgi:short-subunit dehydrogenase
MTNRSKKTIAIFGAGTGLGASVAARFGREGYRVALVARTAASLEVRVAELARAGVEAAGFPADLANLAEIPALVRAIEDRLGPIDVAVYAPLAAEIGFVPAVDLDAAKLEPIARLHLFAPVEVARAVLPGMLARGDGAIVVGGGLSAVQTMPGMSGVGPVMAAVRNYIFTLNAETQARGVYAGTVTIGAMLRRSAGERLLAASGVQLGPHIPVLDPDPIADEVWGLVTRRDRVEVTLPTPARNRDETSAG